MHTYILVPKLVTKGIVKGRKGVSNLRNICQWTIGQDVEELLAEDTEKFLRMIANRMLNDKFDKAKIY